MRAAPGANDRAHFARIVLAPGGAAVATDRDPPSRRCASLGAADAGGDRCVDGGRRARPSRLAKGRYTLHVGELLTDVEAGPPARVTWDLP